MKNMLNYKFIRDRFIELEEKYSVYDLNYKGIYYWKLIRVDLFNQIIRLNNIVKPGHPMSKVHKLKRLIKLLLYATLNIFKKQGLKEYSNILLTHGRKSLINESYEDIYLFDIIKKFDESKTSYLLMDRPDFEGNHQKLKYDNAIYYERFGHVLREMFSSFSSKKIRLENSDIIQDIEKEILSIFNVEIDLMKLISTKSIRFSMEKKYYYKLLNKVKPDTVYILVSYGKEELISAAQDLGIETIEVQHGILNNYHLGYYFPFKTNIPYFPDKLIVYGDYWKESTIFPRNCIVVANHFELLKPKADMVLSRLDKEENVLFISQGTIGDKLSQIAVKFASENLGTHVYYKLHPSEFDSWVENYKDLSESSLNNLKVIKNDVALKELYNMCKYVIGVNSTAIIESMLYECKTFILDFEGYQYMEHLIDNRYATLISKEFDISTLRDAQNEILQNKSYFYK
jgi:hypothetical protein